MELDPTITFPNAVEIVNSSEVGSADQRTRGGRFQ